MGMRDLYFLTGNRVEEKTLLYACHRETVGDRKSVYHKGWVDDEAEGEFHEK